ncbi:MAG: pilus assembly protein [Hydrocarboniphaga sp.]|uniref:TadE family protein n=1 Tax=Hydrocarboniphaga sp. TaxID=2033016 RepID=UPI00262A9679|nr:TadE/TadG family type IV pilus assembly protein [Hydrocarboniphaga sp.]MDB5972398.1 pilus assembly protein [Hydrocarboniphaga sp.]
MDAVRSQGRAKLTQRQSGATAIEFAFVLPLLLALTYAMFVYSYVYVVFESINYAAQQGAESAVAVDPALGNAYLDTVTLHAQATAASVLSWLPADQLSNSIGTNGSLIQVTQCFPTGGGGPHCPTTASGGTPIVVQINFPLLTPALFPTLTLPGIGPVPPLPAQLTGVGVTLLSG